MSISQLIAADDLRKVRYGEKITGLAFASLLQASAASGYDNSAWRSISNLLQCEWADQVGLSSPTAWWAPRRRDARALGARGMTAGSTTNGGDLAISTAALAVAAATRPLTVLEQAGALRTELSGVVDAVLPEWVGGSGYWVAEGQEVGDAALTVAGGSATARTAGATLTLSRRLVQQADAIEQSVAAELQRLVRGTVEAAFINGPGTESQPLGLIQTPGATAVPFAASLATYAELKAMVKAYYDADAAPDAARFLVNPATFADLLTVAESAGSGQYAATITSGRQILGIPALLTNHCPAGKVLLMDPANVSTFFWRAPQVIINRFADDRSGAVRLTCLNDCALLVQRREQLVIGG